MRKFFIFGLIILAGIIIGLAWAEQITLSTYYPSPYGVYRQVEAKVTKLVPSNGPPGFISGQEEEGMLYFDDGTAKTKGLYYWDVSISDWVPLGAPGLGVLQVVGNTDITTPADGTEVLMDGMRISFNITYGASLIVMFSAPIAGEPAGGASIRIYIDGVVEAEQFVRTQQSAGTMVYQLSLHGKKGLAAGDHTVEVKWQGGGIGQPGGTCAERVLTIFPIG